MENYNRKRVTTRFTELKMRSKRVVNQIGLSNDGWGGLERRPAKKIRQSCILDKARLTGCLLSDQEYQPYEFQAFVVDFK